MLASCRMLSISKAKIKEEEAERLLLDVLLEWTVRKPALS